MSLYYECYVTIEPVFDDKLELLKKLAEKSNFHVADLLMQKREEDTPERSKFDTFTTARNTKYDDLYLDMTIFIDCLMQAGFKIWRYKIEDAVLDSKYQDVLHVVGR